MYTLQVFAPGLLYIGTGTKEHIEKKDIKNGEKQIAAFNTVEMN